MNLECYDYIYWKLFTKSYKIRFFISEKSIIPSEICQKQTLKRTQRDKKILDKCFYWSGLHSKSIKINNRNHMYFKISTKLEVHSFDAWLRRFINHLPENFYPGARIGGILNFNTFHFLPRSCRSGDKHYALRDLIVLRVFFVHCDLLFPR